MENYKKLAKQYYCTLARVNCGAEYFKNTPSAKDNEIISYVNLLKNLNSLYSNFATLKETLGIKNYSFTELLNVPESNDFIVHKGLIYGDIKKAREYANTLIKKYEESCIDKDNNFKYELALYISYCLEKVEVDYKPYPNGIKESLKSKEPEIEIIFEAEKKPLAKDSASMSIFDMFAIN